MKIWPIAVQNAMRQTEDAAGGCGIGDEDGPAFTLRADGGHPPSVAVVHDNGAKCLEIATEVSPTLTCQQDKHPWTVFPIDLRNALRDADREGRTGVGFGDAGEPANTVTQGAVPAVAFAQNQRNEVRQMDVVGALAAEPGMKQTAYIAQEREREREEMDDPQYVVRRITPVEAERLQAFPDGYTAIEYNGKPAPDTLRYKVLGNSMTVSVMRWLAERILEADKHENQTT